MTFLSWKTHRAGPEGNKGSCRLLCGDVFSFQVNKLDKKIQKNVYDYKRIMEKLDISEFS